MFRDWDKNALLFCSCLPPAVLLFSSVTVGEVHLSMFLVTPRLAAGRDSRFIPVYRLIFDVRHRKSA